MIKGRGSFFVGLGAGACVAVVSGDVRAAPEADGRTQPESFGVEAASDAEVDTPTSPASEGDASEEETLGTAEAVDSDEDEDGLEPSSSTADAPAAVEEGTDDDKWYDDISAGAFVDAYASVNYNFTTPQAGTNALRAFDSSNGFSFAWAGVNLAYDTEKAAATLDLRFGPAANAGWQDPAIPGIQHIKQAYATWKVLPKLSLDFGRYDTIYGAEVAESWQNHTYTRGGLYNLAQPFWHTGIRAKAQLTELIGLKVMVVNGWGHVVDNNAAKTVGAQVSFTSPGGVLGVYAGYLGGPENPEIDEATGDRVAGANRRFRHLADLVVTADWDRVSLAFNADYAFDDAPAVFGGPIQWYGVMGSGFVRILDWFGVGARGEFLGDPDAFMTGATDAYVGTGTVTLDFRPSEHLIIRLDGRYDGSNEELFQRGSSDTTQHQVTTTLGVVVTSF